jgi:hypothetical protein
MGLFMIRVRRAVVVFAALAASLVLAAPAWAGSPHFVTVTVAADGDTLTVAGREAGLGDEAQVHIVVTATASCVNPAGNQPAAANKETVIAEADVPVQNGMAEWRLTLVAAFQPSCSPPMTVAWSAVTVTDVTSGITTTA